MNLAVEIHDDIALPMTETEGDLSRRALEGLAALTGQSFGVYLASEPGTSWTAFLRLTA